MKKTILITGILLILSGIEFADIIEQNDYIIFTCNNATDGSLLCSSATIDLYDSNGNIAVNGASATNIATGKFKYQVKNSTDRYTVIIDCCTGAIDYAFQVYVTPYTETKANYLDASISSRSTLTTSDNIGINLDDVTGTLDASEIGTDAITADKIAADAITSSELATSAADEIADEVWNEPRSEHTTDNTFGGDALDNDVWTSTKAGYLDASISSRSTLSASDNIGINLNDVTGTLDLNELGFNPALQSNLTQGIVTLTSTTEAQIDNIEADTNELQTNQNWNVWDDTTRTITGGTIDTVNDKTGYSLAADQNINSTKYCVNVNDKSGYSLTSATETQIDNIEADTNELQSNQNWNVWDDGTRTLTACPCSGWATPTDVDNNCISESELNASHGSCNYCTATGFSTHSASDVYSYFTSGSNEDVFKADVSNLLTTSQFNTNISQLKSEHATIQADLDNPNQYKADVSGLADNTTLTAVKTQTDKLQFDGSNYLKTHLYAIEDAILTATKFASDFLTASKVADDVSTEIYNKFISGSNEDQFKADVSSLATQNNITDLQTHGDTYWNTSTGALTSEQNETLYNIYSVVGTKGKWDQSIADMLGYNSSEGNVETDLDSAGGTTPEAVWNYSTRTITGGTIDTVNDKTGYEISGTKTKLDDLNDISASDVWQYNNRNLTYVDNVWSVGTRTLTGFNFAVNLTSNAVDDIWDENITYHLVADTTGKALYNTLGYVEDVSDGAADIIYSWLTTDSNIVQDSELSTTEANIKNSISDLNTSLNTQHGSGSWETGLTSDQNDTLHNIYTVVGNVNEYDQSIVQMLGYNSSDGNVETDLDSAGGTTPAAVWSYSTRTITGGNLSTPDDYKANISSVITHGDMYWNTSTTGLSSEQNLTLYNIYYAVGDKNKYDQSILDMLSYNKSDGNVETDLDTTGGTTPFAVWNYSLSSEGTANETLTAIYEAIIKGGFSIQKETCEWYNIPCIIERIIEKVIK